MYGDVKLYVSKPSAWDTNRDIPGKAKLYFHIKNTTNNSINLSDLSIKLWTAETYDYNRYIFDFRNSFAKCYTSSSAISYTIPANTWSGTTNKYSINGIEVVGPNKEAINCGSIYNEGSYIIPPSGFIGNTEDPSTCIELEYKVYGDAGFRRAQNWYSQEPYSAGEFELPVNYALYSAGVIIDGYEPKYYNSIIKCSDAHTISELHKTTSYSGMSISNGDGYKERVLLRFPFSSYASRDIGRAILYTRSESDINNGSNKDLSVYAIDGQYSGSYTWSSQPAYGSQLGNSYSAYNSSVAIPFSHAFDITSAISPMATSGASFIDLIIGYTNDEQSYYSTKMSSAYIIIDSLASYNRSLLTSSTIANRSTSSIQTEEIITGRLTYDIKTEQETYTFGGIRKDIKTNQIISGIVYKSLSSDMVVGSTDSIHRIHTDYVISTKDGNKLHTNQKIVYRPDKIIVTDSYTIKRSYGYFNTETHIKASNDTALYTDLVIGGIESKTLRTDSCIGFPVTINIPVPEISKKTYGSAALYAKDVGWNYSEVVDSGAVEQSLNSIMRTPKGSMLRRPQDGLSIYDKVLSLANASTLYSMLTTTIKEVMAMDDRIVIDGNNSSIYFDNSSRQIIMKLHWKVYGVGAPKITTFVIDK